MRDPTHLFEGEISPGTRKLAQFISTIFQPPFIALFAFILLSLKCDTPEQIAVCMAVSVLFSIVIPMAIIVFYARKFGNDDLDVVKREERAAPLLIGTVAYALGTVALFLLDVPDVVWVMMLCYSVVTFSIYIISKWWKISVHATGCIGPTMGLIFAFGWPGAFLFISYPLACWSRYMMRKHTPAQLICGGLLGFVLSGAIFLMLLF